MKANSPKANALGRLKCKIGGHSFIVTHRVTDSVNEYQCKHCKEEFTENSNGRLVQLTPKIREINQCLSDFFVRRAKHRLSAVSQPNNLSY